jgi:hypothetical protein
MSWMGCREEDNDDEKEKVQGGGKGGEGQSWRANGYGQGGSKHRGCATATIHCQHTLIASTTQNIINYVHMRNLATPSAA